MGECGEHIDTRVMLPMQSWKMQQQYIPSIAVFCAPAPRSETEERNITSVVVEPSARSKIKIPLRRCDSGKSHHSIWNISCVFALLLQLLVQAGTCKYSRQHILDDSGILTAAFFWWRMQVYRRYILDDSGILT